MKFVFILSVCVITSFDAVSSQACPDTNNYIHCANEGQTCDVPDNVDSGYISYGAAGRWILMPFTNYRSGGANFRYVCNNWIGDIRPGVVKACCYTKTTIDTGFNIDGFQGYFIENSNWRHYALVTQRYGEYDQYVYRLVYNTDLQCSNGHFSDPIPGILKHCNWKYGATTALNKINEWTNCGNEGNPCTGLDTGAAQWVRYGDNDRWLYQLVIARDGQIDCNNGVFDDSLPGIYKRCQKSPAQYAFTDLSGHWNVRQCLGCTQTISMTQGITVLTQNEITETWGVSITASVSASYKFATASVSSTASYNIAQSTMVRNTRHTEQTVEIECSNGYLYQWVTSGVSNNGIDAKLFEWKSNFYVCSDSSSIPQCPPTYCRDGDIRCQAPCKSSWQAI